MRDISEVLGSIINEIPKDTDYYRDVYRLKSKIDGWVAPEERWHFASNIMGFVLENGFENKEPWFAKVCELWTTKTPQELGLEMHDALS